ncbi:MAG: 50S ribosomal protein L18Ae [Pyrodictiaceae archaeon]
MEVKVYRIEGRMLISHDSLPTWWKFSKEVRALKPEHAIEKVLSELGSNHKLKRYHIVIERITEIRPEEARSRYVQVLTGLKRWVKLG